MKSYVMSLDQGTTSSRAIIFDKKGNIVSVAQEEYPQIFPRPGWVEHNPGDIWKSQLNVARAAIKNASIDSSQISGIGITNQRETTILWERDTGKPVYNAIVWQCRRTAGICEMMREDGLGKKIRKKTGLLLDPYFSGTKIRWILDHVKGLRKRVHKGEICFGTVDSWLLYNLTGVHATEPSNASRTMLYNLKTGKWDNELLEIMDVPASLLPEIKPSCGLFGRTDKKLFGSEIPVCGIAGDQQASLFGQACFNYGNAKSTYGTGCFVLANTGRKPLVSNNRLLSTVAWDLGDGPEYALEGSVFICGAVIQWLRDKLKIIKSAPESDKIALSVPDTGGVFFVPAFVGLGAPYWDSEARGSIVGISRGTTDAHIVRAALESIAFQANDLISALNDDIKSDVAELKVDGGASNSSFLMQFQSDILGIPVVRSKIAETTALGAAYLAGLHTGYWDSLDDIRKNWAASKRFEPKLDSFSRENLVEYWHNAVEAARAFKPEVE